MNTADTSVETGSEGVAVMRFEMRHNMCKDTLDLFSNVDAPAWVTGENTVPGSTGDNRWFWQKQVLTLKVGESVKTDFRTITRVA